MELPTVLDPDGKVLVTCDSSVTLLTVADAVPETDPLPAIIVVVPALSAVKVVVAVPAVPVVAVAGFTVPTLVSVLDHEMTTPDILLPF